MIMALYKYCILLFIIIILLSIIHGFAVSLFDYEVMSIVLEILHKPLNNICFWESRVLRARLYRGKL